MVQLVARLNQRRKVGGNVTASTSPERRHHQQEGSVPVLKDDILPELNHICEENSMETNGQSHTTGKRQINHQFAAISPRPFEFIKNDVLANI